MTTDKKRTRRNNSPALKAAILTECEAAGASVAKVAMAHGINANIVHGWRKAARERTAQPVAAPSFVPLTIEAAPAADRRIEVQARRGAVRCR